MGKACTGAEAGCTADRRLVDPHSYTRPGRDAPHLLSVDHHHSSWLSYTNALLDEQVIAPMCSTTRARNGFRYEMLPIALDSQDPSRAALCNAMLAISAYHHLGPHAAVPYKIDALHALSASLAVAPTQHSGATMEAQLAACMMLSMYSVRKSLTRTVRV